MNDIPAHPTLLDPLLNEKGRSEAVAARAITANLSPQLIVCSPLRRTTQTALLAFDHAIQTQNIPVLAHEACREGFSSGNIYDMRLPRASTMAEFPNVDYAHRAVNGEPVVADNQQGYDDMFLKGETENNLADRAYEFLEFLADRPETDIAVSSHSKFLFTLMVGAVATDDIELKGWFKTGEIKSVDCVISPNPRYNKPKSTSRAKIIRSRARKEELSSVWELKKKLMEEGVTGPELFEKITQHTMAIKEKHRSNRCLRCYHDEKLCVCQHLPYLTEECLDLPVKCLVLMHHKEYLSAGDDAKLIIAMLPKTHAELFVYGKEGEWERFEKECNVDPAHTLTLWPGDKALTVDEFLSGGSLHAASPWRQLRESSNPPPSSALPVLRVVGLDGVYNHARNMFSAMKKRLTNNPPFVALHPTTLSVYHRATQNYASASAKSVLLKENPDALRICTVEAFALLLKELGENESTTGQLVAAVETNNSAIHGKRSQDTTR
jgi:DTW domain-containing protein YfiP/broad specificity phosphatase PhoE